MKLKNVKVGTRVILKEDSDNYRLKKGAVGTIQEDKDSCPYVKWDNLSSGVNCFGKSTQNDIWAVSIKQLKRIK